VTAKEIANKALKQHKEAIGENGVAKAIGRLRTKCGYAISNDRVAEGYYILAKKRR
jgi:hypothetical protein